MTTLLHCIYIYCKEVHLSFCNYMNENWSNSSELKVCALANPAKLHFQGHWLWYHLELSNYYLYNVCSSSRTFIGCWSKSRLTSNFSHSPSPASMELPLSICLNSSHCTPLLVFSDHHCSCRCASLSAALSVFLCSSLQLSVCISLCCSVCRSFTAYHMAAVPVCLSLL